MIMSGAFELYFVGILSQNISIAAIVCFFIASACFIINYIKKRK